MDRSSRILLLLVIDTVFFFVELIVGMLMATATLPPHALNLFISGYAVGSLALVADSFHMLNDVMSLVVALYAIKLANQTHIDSRYSYGWHRAEILAALINGVFLLALCFSISLEALERFFSTPDISNPKLIVLVGSLGLASNMVGLFLFHEHGHSHDHDHGKLPETSPSKPASFRSITDAGTDTTPRNISPVRRSRERSDSYSSLYGHPVATRASMVQAAQDIAYARSPSPVNHIRKSSHHARSHSRPALRNEDTEETGAQPVSPFVASPEVETSHVSTETTPLLGNNDAETSEGSITESVHSGQAHGSSGHGHSHGSMNMRALVLHVLGDALGNVGVIATGLVIWLTEWSFKFYFDPVISLVITVIIFSSALPLVKSTSFILLQGVPSNVSMEDVRSAILEVEGVLSLHELHIWQLSENKIVASVHVTASRNHDFMPVASKIRMVLHLHGIHSSTIQPEYHHPHNSPPEEHLKVCLF
ncbi:hypothetical protein EUX98_g4103 [Antrodiella citrinella]|uniref:Cation efflux protein cytoplasmic domain-containing protein n=1 Tax=Antrodiella citrinella TaxID=2447956 RepID=A0A4S4MUT1_9APHY|nr:hypothetical protein EUX98_g4103 [Antrodiella citrinella]